jgi:uncharacterized protein
VARRSYLPFALAIVLSSTEALLAVALLATKQMPAGAQFFDDRFPSQNRRQRGPFDWFEPAPLERAPPQRAAPQQERAPPPVDYSRAPAPKKADPKAEGTVTTPIMVFGDAMADWLAYGLELAYADSPEIGILRRHRTNSGLIRTEVRNDPHGEYPDWPKAAREMIAGEKPKFVLMMVGVNDRRQLREAAQVAPAPRVTRQAPQPVDDSAALELDKPVPDKSVPEPAAPGDRQTLEFRTDAWSEAYSRRIDDTIAALKTSGVPVFWVGLPPLRGQKSAADIPFLNDLYRSRADKAGIIYIDVWDGFVDEDGRYAQSGPDFEGQTRRLRTSDGVYFTQAGARKLAHYVEREVQRWLSARARAGGVGDPRRAEGRGPRPGRPTRCARATALGAGNAVDRRARKRFRRASGRQHPPAGGRCDGDEGAGEGRGDTGTRRTRGRLRLAAPRHCSGRKRPGCGDHRSADDPDGGGA